MDKDVLIIYKTVYHGGTIKLADSMAKEIGCKTITVTEAVKKDLSSYKYIGLGSGIYFTSHHPEIVQIVSHLSPNQKDQLRAKKFINKILPQYSINTNKTGNGKHHEINSSKCKGCGICINICPLKVYTLSDGKSFPAKEEDCVHCGLCKDNCPEKAISVHHSLFEYIKRVTLKN